MPVSVNTAIPCTGVCCCCVLLLPLVQVLPLALPSVRDHSCCWWDCVWSAAHTALVWKVSLQGVISVDSSILFGLLLQLMWHTAVLWRLGIASGGGPLSLLNLALHVTALASSQYLEPLDPATKRVTVRTPFVGLVQ